MTVKAASHDGNTITAANQFFAKRTEHDNVLGPWQPCFLEGEVENIDDYSHVVRFCSDNRKKLVASYELADASKPEHSELKRGIRVIAKRCGKKLPYQLDAFGQRIRLYSNSDSDFYPGIVFGSYSQHLVFFDDGMVQYVPIEHIRRVLEPDGCKHGAYHIYSLQNNLFFNEFY